ncbi:MAG: hypothetical protein MJK15_03080 [Colwellia sp.]|nr:hypothetical protein [Colwellia sp.]
MPAETKNFNVKTDPKLICTCGHPKCDKRSVKQWVLCQVQLMRNDANRPFTITSAGRCPYHPDELHRIKPADHQNCIVVDIEYETIEERNEIMVLAGRYGATAVAYGNGFVHCAWRVLDLDDMRVRTWTY